MDLDASILLGSGFPALHEAWEGYDDVTGDVAKGMASIACLACRRDLERSSHAALTLRSLLRYCCVGSHDIWLTHSLAFVFGCTCIGSGVFGFSKIESISGRCRRSGPLRLIRCNKGFPVCGIEAFGR